jgi:cobalt/nickel transport system permease protein
MAIALLVTLLSPLASTSPDGLEWVAGQKGFLQAAQDAPFQLLPDYTLPFLGETAVSTILAGVIGVLLVGGLTALVARSMRRRSPMSEVSN